MSKRKPLIRLVAIVKNEAGFIQKCLESAKPIIDSYCIVDTGSTDNTMEVIQETLADVPGELHEREFVNFGHNRTEALALAQKGTQWLLELDADMTVEAHEGLLDWLRRDPDPEVGQWMVEIREARTVWRLPRLIRGDMKWRYIGAAHEYLHPEGRKRRILLGLTLHHHGSHRHPIQKFDHYLTLLKPDLEAGDPRAVFYSAECLRCLGCIPQAIDLYRQRESMDGFDEEAWYAGYMAAKLSKSVPELFEVWKKRPWRPEPLYAAADLVQQIEHNDVLFVEQR